MLDRAFFERPAVQVAPLLLGAVLSHTTDTGTVAVRLTEVEAYEGVGEDPGSHAHRGPTPRNRTMFGPAAHLYAYFTYGMHTCANVTCLPARTAAAVLVRAGEVNAGEALATERRGGAAPRNLARGPANLASALGIALADDGADLLTAGTFSIALPARPVAVAAGPRVGVSGEGGSAAYPWRFWIPGDPTVSAYRAAKARP